MRSIQGFIHFYQFFFVNLPRKKLKITTETLKIALKSQVDISQKNSKRTFFLKLNIKSRKNIILENYKTLLTHLGDFAQNHPYKKQAFSNIF